MPGATNDTTSGRPSGEAIPSMTPSAAPRNQELHAGAPSKASSTATLAKQKSWPATSKYYKNPAFPAHTLSCIRVLGKYTFWPFLHISCERAWTPRPTWVRGCWRGGNTYVSWLSWPLSGYGRPLLCERGERSFLFFSLLCVSSVYGRFWNTGATIQSTYFFCLLFCVRGEASKTLPRYARPHFVVRRMAPECLISNLFIFYFVFLTLLLDSIFQLFLYQLLPNVNTTYLSNTISLSRW